MFVSIQSVRNNNNKKHSREKMFSPESFSAQQWGSDEAHTLHMGLLTSSAGKPWNVSCDLPGKSNVKNKEATLGRLFKEVKEGTAHLFFLSRSSLRSLYCCKLHLILADSWVYFWHSAVLFLCRSKFTQRRSRALEDKWWTCTVLSCDGESEQVITPSLS